MLVEELAQGLQQAGPCGLMDQGARLRQTPRRTRAAVAGVAAPRSGQRSSGRGRGAIAGARSIVAMVLRVGQLNLR
ncbi:MAG: hypothetical protein ACK58P_11310, partial [Betaproteobacteria bacterium]